MEFLREYWPQLVTFVALVGALTRMRVDIDVLKEKVRTLFDVAESLGFGKELERRFVKELVNNPNFYQRNKLVISDYVKEVNIVKSKQPWNIPNPLRPIFHVVDFVRGADANPIEPLFKISWGHKKTKIL